MPETHNMGRIEKGGFAEPVEGSVEQLLYDFDQTYSEMLRLLQRAWEAPAEESGQAQGQGSLVLAIDRMFDLEQYAKKLMQISRLDDPQLKYGPRFKYLGPPNTQ